MNVASLELCKELYELSGWNIGEFAWASWNNEDKVLYEMGGWDERVDWLCPAYTLGYLLRKLQDAGLPVLESFKERNGNIRWASKIVGQYFELADTPEDALTKLAIELFKQGVLKS